ncbi:MAG: beta strand repeat-containing protein [Terriglobia bacterium]
MNGGTYASGTFTISGSTITGGVANLDAQGSSSIANSTINATSSVTPDLNAENGATLDIGNTNLSGLNLNSYGGTITTEHGTFSGMFGFEVDPGGTLTMTSTSATLATQGFVDVYGTMTLQNGAQAVDGGTEDTSLLVGGGFSGNTASGQLNILSGSKVTLPYGVLSSGGITVSGSGSELSDANSLSIGSGALLVNSAALVNAGQLSIYGPGSATVTDSGSEMNVAAAFVGTGSGATTPAATLTIENHATMNVEGAVIVGGATASNAGIGTVLVQSGGTLTSDGGSIDSPVVLIGPISSVTVTGVGSTWTNNGELTVGNAGFGAMTVSTQGVVSNHAATLGAQAGSNGTVTVTGGETEWLTNGELTVGDAGTGTLTISNDAVASSDSGTLAKQASSGSTVTVTGGGSLWDMGADLTVAESGMGQLSILNGGEVKDASTSQTAEAVVGANAQSIGTVTVSGANSRWTNGGDLTIGKDGAGSMTVSLGGSVTNSDGTLAEGQGSTSTVLVTDPGSLWSNSGDLTVGDSGQGTLSIQNSGTVTSVGGTVGGEATGNGTVTINSGQWSMASDLTVGEQGKGTLTGQSAALSSASGSIGESAGSVGNVTLGDSNWTMTGDLSVGGQGAGSLNLAGATTVSNQEGTIGEESTGAGGVTVAAGSRWTNSGDLTVGDKGRGTLGILQGGKVADAAGDVGSELNSQGTVTVAGMWQNSQDLTIGDSGSGTMTISGSGSVTNTDGDIAANVSATGKVMVQGSGSSMPTWYNSGSLAVGDGGKGEIDVLNGGRVYSESGAIGGAQNSQGTVKVDGAGSLWAANEPGDTGNIEIGTNQGTGKLTVSNGGTVQANHIEVGANGTLDGVNGTLIGNVLVESGGTVSPGDPGPMNINGNFDLSSGSTLTLEIASAADYDSLNITGDGAFDGIIDLDFLNGFAPSSGDSFDFISDSGTFDWDPSAIDFTGITPGTYTTDLSGGFGLTASSNWSSGSPSSPVPEPGTLTLLGIGLAGFGIFSRKRRSRKYRLVRKSSSSYE